MTQHWSHHAIWWHLHPLTFLGVQDAAPHPAGGPGEAGGASRDPALLRLLPWLDYIVELGCNGLLLGPVFASMRHGYDTVDYYRVDERLGTEDDLVQLMAECRERGVAVLLDGVFNHVGRDFWAFRNVLTHGHESRYANWFHIDFAADGPDGFGYANFESHRHLVALNHNNPAVADYVSDVMGYWLDRGAAGWRLDAAYAVPLPFWRRISDRVHERHPQTWLMGEVIHGEYGRWVTEGSLDSVTEYELWKSTWSSLNDVNFFELAWTMDRHNTYLRTFTPLTFVGNHDVTRIASRVHDRRHLPHAFVTLFTLAGNPAVYAGDEQGFVGVKEDREGGDDAIRPAFPARPAGLPPHGWPLYRLHQDLIGMRRRYPWLVTSQNTILTLRNESLAFASHHPDGQSSLVVLLNLADAWFRPDVDLSGAKPILCSGDHADVGTVEPHGWAILER